LPICSARRIAATLGDKRFVAELERKTGLTLRKGKPGRKAIK